MVSEVAEFILEVLPAMMARRVRGEKSDNLLSLTRKTGVP